MAGLRELLSPYLKRKLAAEEQCTGDSAAARTIFDYSTCTISASDEELGERDRHHYATSPAVLKEHLSFGVERLYKRVAVIMPTNVCAAHCRWCLRACYGEFTLSEAELRTAVKYCNSDPNLYEVLISGGDPLMTPRLLGSLLQYIVEDAPNIRVVRIASRVPLQAPERISEELIGLLGIYKSLRIELGTHINHASELFPEVKEALERPGVLTNWLIASHVAQGF